MQQGPQSLGNGIKNEGRDANALQLEQEGFERDEHRNPERQREGGHEDPNREGRGYQGRYAQQGQNNYGSASHASSQQYRGNYPQRQPYSPAEHYTGGSEQNQDYYRPDANQYGRHHYGEQQGYPQQHYNQAYAGHAGGGRHYETPYASPRGHYSPYASAQSGPQGYERAGTPYSHSAYRGEGQYQAHANNPNRHYDPQSQYGQAHYGRPEPTEYAPPFPHQASRAAGDNYGHAGYEPQQAREGYGSYASSAQAAYPNYGFGQGNFAPHPQAEQYREYGGSGPGYSAPYHQGSSGVYSAYGPSAGAPRNRGPRGYTRSDERVREDVCDRLCESGIDASDVEVTVSAGEVTLTGTVTERHAKHAIENIAEAVPGARDVNNQLRVQRDQQSQSLRSGSGSNSSKNSPS